MEDEMTNYESMPLSGRYEGNMIYPTGGRSMLELRIDIDKVNNYSPALNRVSGDFYQSYLDSNMTQYSISDSLQSNVYLGSWVVDKPIISSISSSSKKIYGHVRFWKSGHPGTTIKVFVYRPSRNSTEHAEVTFTDVLGNASKYLCIKKSHYFRDIELEIDVTKAVSKNPVLPVYDTYWHSNRPAGLSRRILTVQEAYREAGISLSIIQQNNVIDDDDASFVSWDDDELYHTMETYYSQYNNILPAWKMWGFLCGNYVKDNVLGIMFDADIRFSNGNSNSTNNGSCIVSNKPQRRGFAIFKNNPVFNDLISDAPADEKQAYALRQYLRTFVHEAGHTFNLVHPWGKDKPSSLSWMNYPSNYPYGPNDHRNNECDYWNNFRFSFDDEELIHMRHGDRSAVIMGGDPWSSLGNQTMKQYPFPMVSENGPPIEFLLRSKDHFEYMEPVDIELRLRNLFDFSVNVDSLLNPEFGRIKIFIVKPNGGVSQFMPILEKESKPVMLTLNPIDVGTQGSDRYSENIVITYGKDGFYFNHPGEYQIQAIYQGFENVVIPSNIIRLIVKPPMSTEEDNIAYQFFTYQVGMNLYLRGSQSSFLSDGRRKLEYIFNLERRDSMHSKIAYVLACAENKPFFEITADKKLKQTHKASPEKALEFTQPAKEFYLKAMKAKRKSFNIPYHNLIQTRVSAHVQLNKENDAKEELMELSNSLVDINSTLIKRLHEQKKAIIDKTSL